MFCPWWKWPNWMWNCCKNKHLELERQKPEPVLNGFSDPLFKWWVLESGGEFLIQLFCILCFKLGFPRSLVTQIGCGISHETCKAVEAMSPHRLQRLRSQKKPAACHVDISMAVSGWRKGWLKATLVTAWWLFVSLPQLSISKLFHQEEKENFQTNCPVVSATATVTVAPTATEVTSAPSKKISFWTSG